MAQTNASESNPQLCDQRAWTTGYLRERRKLTGEWTANARIIAGFIGAGLGALIPIPAVSQIVRSIGGLILVECGLWAWRFVWLAPKEMYFDTLKRVDLVEKEQTKAVDANEAKWLVKRKVYADSIDGLTAQVGTLHAEVKDLEARLHRKMTNQKFADVLTERYNVGLTEIMNSVDLYEDTRSPAERLYETARPLSERHSTWLAQESIWTRGIRGLLEEHEPNAQVIAHFWNIHEFTLGAFHPVPLINKDLSMFSERLKRLKSIINEYAEVKILKD